MPGTLNRRTLLAGLAATPFAGTARAQSEWPARPVRVLVPYPPAGGADTTARIVFQKVSELLGQQFVIENRGGAGGTIGEAVVAKADPDGYQILHDATAFSVNSSLYPNLQFNYRKDFEPVALVSLVPNILVVTPSVPVKTVADVIAFAKASADGITMASSGIKISHVPYRGGGIALQDVISGQVKFFFSNGSSVVGLIKGGQVKAIAHTGKGKLESLPDIPPVSDTLAGFEAYEWNGVFVPHGTSPAIVRTLNRALNDAIKSPDVQARFKQLNIDSKPNTPEEFRAFVDEQMERWGKVVKDANIKLG